MKKGIDEIDLRNGESTTKALSAMKRELARINRILSTTRRKLRQTRRQVGNVLSNQRHYLRYRAPAVVTRGRKMVEHAKKFMQRMERIPKLNIKTSCKAGERYNIIFLCTNNEARKLRALANIDFRRFNTCGRLGEKSRKFPSLHYTGVSKRK
jgi:hypothetical protein